MKQNLKYKKRSIINDNKNDHIILKRAASDDLDHKSDYSTLYPDYAMPPGSGNALILNLK